MSEFIGIRSSLIVHRMHAQKPDKSAFVDWLSRELLQFCGPIFVAPSLRSYPAEMIANGTYALVDTGEKRILVTCGHVWDAYEEAHDRNPATVLAVSLGEGDSNIAFKNPESHRMSIDRDLDLVVLEFEPQTIRVPHNKKWFKISEWPIMQAKKGEHILTLGFPGAWRKASGMECCFRYVAMPFVVTDVSIRSIAAFADGQNDEVLNDMKNSLGGISGSPAYSIDDKGGLHLVGFAKQGMEAAEAQNRKYTASQNSPLPAVLFTHASFLQPNGSIVG